MTTTPDPNELVSATQTLAERVHELGEKIALSEQSQREIKAHQIEIEAQAIQQAKNVAGIKAASHRLRLVVGGLVLLVVLLLAGFTWLWNVADEAKSASKATRANAVTNCENTNEARRGTRRLWLGVLDAPRPAGSPVRTEEQLQQVADLRVFIEQLFQDRDCQNLERKYPLPELPDSLKPRSKR